MDRVRARVGDKRVLALVEAFLKAGVLSRVYPQSNQQPRPARWGPHLLSAPEPRRRDARAAREDRSGSSTQADGRDPATRADGRAWTLKAGDRFVIEPGFTGSWEVVETTVKRYVIVL